MKVYGTKMKKQFVLIIVILLLVVNLGAYSFTQDKVVNFCDENLEKVIREIINKSKGEIYQSDLIGITELHLKWSGIKELSGIEYCTNLTVLNLNGNSISDISALSTLTNLTELSLGDNNLSDIISYINVLESLPNLTVLNLNGNSISDISALSTFINLHYLNLENNNMIIDFEKSNTNGKVIKNIINSGCWVDYEVGNTIIGKS
ncbi:MAG: leucine-rich repeat domain-containing protein [Spirochaetota bacterium]